MHKEYKIDEKAFLERIDYIASKYNKNILLLLE